MSAQPNIAGSLREARVAPARPDWLPSDLFPFESRYVSINGHKVHYVDEGRGPPLLMLHGNPTWSFLYRRIIAGLSSQYRCIALDYPGFGLSQAAAGYGYTPAEHSQIVTSFIRELDLREYTMVGHDWGGPIGLGAAVAMPERLSGLVLFNTFAWPAQGDPHFERFSKFMGGPVGAFLIRRLNFFVNVMLPMGTHAHMPPAVKRAYRGPFPTVESRIAIRVLPREILGSRVFLESVASKLGALAHLPTLIVWGEQDIAFQGRYCVRLQTLFPRHTTVRLPKGRHYVQEDSPEEIINALRSWMALRPAADSRRSAQ